MSDEAFRWVIAVAVILGCVAFLVQAGFVIALYRIAKRTQDKVVPLAERADPILASAQNILVENRPRITEMSTEALEMIKTTRQEVTRISNLLEETTVRARARIAEIDEKVIDTVEQVEQVGGAVKGAVLKPVREANAIMAGVKAAVVTYAQGGRRPSVDHATQDEEMFI
jgi:F0F1-type ATP synthase membrane subunit b/b'